MKVVDVGDMQAGEYYVFYERLVGDNSYKYMSIIYLLAPIDNEGSDCAVAPVKIPYNIWVDANQYNESTTRTNMFLRLSDDHSNLLKVIFKMTNLEYYKHIVLEEI